MSTLPATPLRPQPSALRPMTRAELAECTRLQQQGWSLAQLAPRYGTSAATLCRMLKRHEANGGDEEATLAKAYATGPRDEHQLTTDEVRVLKLGRVLAVADVLIYSVGTSEPVARASLTYSIPPVR